MQTTSSEKQSHKMKTLSVLAAFATALVSCGLILGLYCAPSFAATSNELLPVKMRLNANDTILIKGYRGQLEVIGNEMVEDITVTVNQGRTVQKDSSLQAILDEFQFSFRRDGDQVIVSFDGPISKAAWNELLLNKVYPEMNLRIVAPSRSLEVQWAQGPIRITAWRSNVHVSSTDSNIVIQEGEGDVRIATQSGVIQVAKRKGEVHVDSYMAKVDLQDIDGQIEVENFSGESRVSKISGSVAVSSYKGVTRLAEVKGRLDFKNGLSPMHIEKFEGELRGRSGQGPVFAEIRGPADVRVEAQEGSVNLKLPGSGAWVNLGTEEGNLIVPGFLKSTRSSNQQFRTGRLRGGAGGSVFIRTTSGDIRVR